MRSSECNYAEAGTAYNRTNSDTADYTQDETRSGCNRVEAIGAALGGSGCCTTRSKVVFDLLDKQTQTANKMFNSGNIEGHDVSTQTNKRTYVWSHEKGWLNDHGVDMKELAEKAKQTQRTCKELGIQIENPNIPEETRKRFEALIEQYHDTFAISDEELREGARIKPIELNLKDKNSAPVRGYTYQHSAIERKIIKQQLTAQIENGFLVRGSSAYSSGLITVQKGKNERRVVWD